MPRTASRRSRLAGVFAASALCARPAHAALDDAFKQVANFEDQIVDRVIAVVDGGALSKFAATLFVVLALALFMLKAMGWALRGFKLAEMVETTVRILLTGFMLASFTVVVPACFSATLYVGQALLAGITGLAQGSPQALAMPSSLVDTLVTYGLQISPNCHLDWYKPWNILDCIKGGAIALVAALVMSVVLGLLCIAIMLVDIWGFWLYGISLAVGPVLLPFTLYDRLAFLFEGWLRFFFGTVVYVILARINLALVAVAILTFWGSTPSALGTFTAPTLAPLDDITNILGLMLFAGVGIFTLLATGRFSAAVVAGAAAGGLNFAKVARAVTRVVAPNVASALGGGGGFKAGWRRQSSKQQRQRPQRHRTRGGDNGITHDSRRSNDGRSSNGDGSPSSRRMPAVIRVPVQVAAMPFGAAFAGLSMGYAATRKRFASRPRFGDTRADPDNIDTVPGP